MTSPFPVVPWPADNTLINKALLDAKINAPLADLDTRVTRPGFGEAEIGSTSAQNVVTGSWVKLGWTSPSSVVSGSGISVSPSGLIIANPGRYLITALAIMTGNSGGVRRLIAVDADTATDPGVSAIVIDDDVPKAANSVYLTVAGKLATTLPNTALTIWVFQDSGVALSVGRRVLQAERTS